MGYVFKQMDKYVDKPRKPVHPEMRDVENGEELLVFELKDDDSTDNDS